MIRHLQSRFSTGRSGIGKIMVEALEEERKRRLLDSIPETVRSVLGEYFKQKIER